MDTRFIVLAFAAVLAGVAELSLGLAGDSTPTLSSPYALPLIVPLGFFGFPRFFIALVYGATFLAWSNQLLHGRLEIPRRSRVLFIVSTLLSCTLFVLGWHVGLQYQGRTYVLWSAIFAAAGAAVLLVLLEWNRRTPTFANSALFHFMLFAWLGTYAMPWLGETP